MDQLPSDVQFFFLLTLPYQDIKHYCDTNHTIRNLCQNTIFWSSKAYHDFGITLKVVIDSYDRSLRPSADQGRELYLFLMNEFTHHPVSLINPLITHNLIDPLPKLLKRSKLITKRKTQMMELEPKLYQILISAINNNNYQATKILIKYILSYENNTTYYSRWLIDLMYYQAVVNNQVQMIELLTDYFDLKAAIFVYYDSLLYGNLPVARYLQEKLSEKIFPLEAIDQAIRSGDNEVIDYVNEFYPDVLRTRDEFDQLVSQYIHNNSYNAVVYLGKLIEFAGELIDFDWAINIAKELSRYHKNKINLIKLLIDSKNKYK